MSFIAHRWLLTLCLVCLAAGVTNAAEPSLIIVSPDRNAAYQEATNALMEELEKNGVVQSEVEQLTQMEWERTGTLRPRLFVTLGVQACAALAKIRTTSAVLCTLLPSLSFERILRDNARTVSPLISSLYMSQPLSRQLDLVKLALPKTRKVGVLFGPESRAFENRLQAAADARGLQVVSTVLEPGEPVANGLKNTLNESDALLALPDPQVYNAASIQNILLVSYRVRVPMVAFSPAYVRAGALLALYSTPAQIGQQAGVMARGVLQGRSLGAPEYPQNFTISVNDNVARSMGLNLNAEELTQRLQRLERQERRP